MDNPRHSSRILVGLAGILGQIQAHSLPSIKELYRILARVDDCKEGKIGMSLH